MNKKTDQDRAEVYIKTRATKQLKENFKMCCEANGVDMSGILLEFVKDYIATNMHKVIKGEDR